MGEDCGGDSVCENGAHCLKGKCTAPLAAGAPCENDLECGGACLRKTDGGAKGVCGMDCDGYLQAPF